MLFLNFLKTSLIIGGARSGKSRYAQTLASSATRVVYVATARVEDAEMQARVARHRSDRPATWVTVEAPLDLPGAAAGAEAECVLIDCLTVWLSNYCWEHRSRTDGEIEAGALGEVGRLFEAGRGQRMILVTNEVGCGIVPESPVGRFFRDVQGRVNQRAAALADEVFLVVAGIPVRVKA